jgi:tRNA modification GTPase
MPAYLQDTIAALATPPGVGAIAVVRLSGRDALSVARRVLARVRGDGSLPLGPSHRARLGWLLDPHSGERIDEVLVLPMLSPSSYTGEDVVEIHCHGGRIIPQLVLRALFRAGARGARPGEFTERAFLNGKLDLCQAEAVAELISASSDAAVAVACAQLGGRLSTEVDRIRSLVLEARALAEAYLDFPEDDLPAGAAGEIGATIGEAESGIRQLAASYERGRLMRSGARCVLVGKPNTGKSSLLNAILGRERALVSEEPGTTRDFLEEPATVGGIALLVYDTAGMRTSESRVEAAGIARTGDLLRDADLAIVVLDGSSPIDDLDRGVLDLTASSGARLVVRNKADLPAAWGRPDLVREAGELPLDPLLDVSALTGSGVAELCSTLERTLLGVGHESASDPPVIVLERHQAAFLRAADLLSAAADLVARGQELELVALELQSASRELEVVLGSAAPEEVLDLVFRRFCIGK